MASKQAYVRHLGGVTFIGKSNSGHWVSMDGPEEFGGKNAGNRPKELVLIGLTGCTASDVATILEKKRVPFTDMEMNVSAEEAEEHPKVFTKVHIEFVVYGNNINPRDVERAIELSETKYCSVSAMLKPKVEITTSFRIEPPKKQ